MFCLVAASCDREGSLLISETELPREVVVIEEGEYFILHNYGARDAVDTIGTTLYDEEFKWFQFFNFTYDWITCESDPAFRIETSLNPPRGGGNDAGLMVEMFGQVPDIETPVRMAAKVTARDQDGNLREYKSGFCDANVELTITEIGEGVVRGHFSGSVVAFAPNDSNCDHPDVDVLAIDAEFYLPLQYCD